MNISHDELIETVSRTAQKVEPKLLHDGTPATHETLADDMARYFARGGRIDRSNSVQLRAEIARYSKPGAETTRRYVRGAHQNIAMPGSLTGPKPKRAA